MRWNHAGHEHELTLRKDTTYVLPSGFRVRLEKTLRRRVLEAGGHAASRHSVPQALHGIRGRKIGDFEVHRQRAAAGAPVFVRDYQADMDQVAEILAKDFSTIFKIAWRTRARGGQS